MHYLLTLTFRPGEGPQEGTPEFDAEMARWGALNEEMRQAGVARRRQRPAPVTRRRPSARRTARSS